MLTNEKVLATKYLFDCLIVQIVQVSTINMTNRIQSTFVQVKKEHAAITGHRVTELSTRNDVIATQQQEQLDNTGDADASGTNPFDDNNNNNNNNKRASATAIDPTKQECKVKNHDDIADLIQNTTADMAEDYYDDDNDDEEEAIRRQAWEEALKAREELWQDFDRKAHHDRNSFRCGTSLTWHHAVFCLSLLALLVVSAIVLANVL